VISPGTPNSPPPAMSQGPESKAPATPAATSDPAPQPSSAHPLREISFAVSHAGDKNVEVRLVDRAGQIHVAVRTEDPVLASSLRSDLGDLVNKLERHGFSTDVWTSSSAAPASTETLSNSDHPQDSPQNFGGQQGHGSHAQQQPRQQSGRQTPDWLEQLGLEPLENELNQKARSD
jgi:hypothetical protein